MKDRCIEIEELGAVLGLGAEDPRRLHLDRCPRCRARFAAYLEFLEPGSEPAGARVGEAEARLGARLHEEVTSASGRAPGTAATGRSRLRFTPARWFGTPGLRAAWAAAAAIVVVGVLYAVHVLETPGTGRLLLRGDEAGTQGAAGAPALLPPLASGDAVVLRWLPAPHADAYQVRLYSAELSELARLGPFPDTTAVLRASDRPPGVARGALLLWRVVALRSGDEMAASTIGRLRSP